MFTQLRVIISLLFGGVQMMGWVKGVIPLVNYYPPWTSRECKDATLFT